MGRLVIPLGFLLLIAALAFGSCASQSPSTLDYARERAQLAALERQEESEAYWAPIRAAVLNGALIIAVVSATLGASAWGSLALIRFRQERMPRRGDALLPVRALDLPTTAPRALGAWHGAQQLAASHAPVPQSLTYAPHFSNRADITGAAVDTPALPAAGGVPTFAQLLDGGRVGRGQPLLLGLDAETGAELVGDWRDLYSTVVAGFSGSGKTTTQRFLAAQTALHGARFVVIDPHADAGDESLAATLAPLAGCYLCEPASDDRRILEAVRFVADIGETRVKGRSSDQTPVILWADELTKLLGRSAIGDQLAQLLEAVAQEYRKKRVFVCGSGQIWTAERVTSELRDSFASVIAHRMKRGQARMLLPTDEAALVERLETGRAILWRTSGETTTIAIPNTTRADIDRVAGLLTADAPTMPRVAHVSPGPAPVPVENTSATRGPHVENTSQRNVYSASERHGTPFEPLDPQAARILARFASGATLHDLAGELAGTKNTNASAYRTARQQVEGMLRSLAARGGVL